MKLHIIRLAIGLTALVASFLPQKAQADPCKADCWFGKCEADWICTCVAGWPVCINWP